jgi:hypothetical protein
MAVTQASGKEGSSSMRESCSTILLYCERRRSQLR